MQQPTTDQSDVVVGTIRAPDWVRRIPPVAWLFVAAAIVDAWLRIALGDVEWSIFLSPLHVGTALATLAAAAASVALPAAVLSGPTVGVARRAFLYGSLAIAAAELIALARLVSTRLFRDPYAEPAAGATLETAVTIVASVLVVAGVFSLAAGARWAAGERGDGRASPAAVRLVLLATVGAIVAQLWLAVVTIVAEPGAFSQRWLGPPVPAYVATALLASAATGGWGVLAANAIAGRGATERRTLGWTLLAVAAALIVGSALVAALLIDVVVAAGLVREGGPDFLPVFSLAAAAGAVGRLLLVAALAVGPERARMPDVPAPGGRSRRIASA